MLGGLGVASTFAEEGSERGGGTLFAAALPLFCPASALELEELGVFNPNEEAKTDIQASVVEANEVLAKITTGSRSGVTTKAAMAPISSSERSRRLRSW